ncbi:Dynein intermediate chain [Gracilaria domingensis]|nr:Dynein intermediate chain [Gracilaria domingensis]KAI0561442.1 Dynein intermediate chain [Gracilaria domingensis]
MNNRFDIEERRRRLQQQKETLIGLQSFKKKGSQSAKQTNHGSPSYSMNQGRSFNDHSSFSRVFKAELNLPPSNETYQNETAFSASRGANAEKRSYLPELMGDANFSSKFGLLPSEEEQQGKQADRLYSGTQRASDGSPLQFQVTLKDKFTHSRPITGIRFHKNFDNIVVTSHGSRADKCLSTEPGLNAIWCLDEGRSTLQRTLTANAAISALELPNISPTLVIGGTISGSILVWDTRMKSSLPIHALEGDTAFVAGFHDRQKVTAVKTTANSSPYFVSTSIGGHLCKWTLSKPGVPITKDTLRENPTSAELNISSFDFPRTARLAGGEKTTANRFTSLFVGDDIGGLHRADGNDSSWTVESASGDDHDAVVTAVSAHPFGHRVAYLDDILISASADWTIKLWYFHKSQRSICLGTYDMVEYGRVNDVAWSNQHPTVFCAGTEAGYISLFDISNRLSPSNSRNYWHFETPDANEDSQITAIQWDHMSRHVCAGSSKGTLSVWQCTSDFASLPDAEWTGQYLKSKQNT